jgi:hypothetical protein
MAFGPAAGGRRAKVAGRRPAAGFAEVLGASSDPCYADAKAIALAPGNPNAHTPAPSYEAFEPETARRPAGRSETRYTPERGRRPDPAGADRSVLARQCRTRRADNADGWDREIGAREDRRNDADSAPDGRVTTTNARIKRNRLYPSLQDG